MSGPHFLGYATAIQVTNGITLVTLPESALPRSRSPRRPLPAFHQRSSTEAAFPELTTRHDDLLKDDGLKLPVERPVERLPGDCFLGWRPSHVADRGKVTIKLVIDSSPGEEASLA